MSAGVAQAVTSSASCSAALGACSSYASSWTPRLQSSRAVRCRHRRAFRNIKAVSAPEETNEVERAPEKEASKISVDRSAEENRKVSGTFPPSNRKWTGYVEKDTAGQTSIYAVEPTVYVAESGFSSGTSGTSSEGSSLTVRVAASVAAVLVIVAGIVLQRVASTPNPEPVYDGPTLSFYIQKFKPPATPVVEAQVAPQVSDSVEAESGSS